MEIPCKRCRTQNAWDGGPGVICALCGTRIQVSETQRRRLERAENLEERRRAMAPFNLGASLAVIGITLALVIGLFARRWTGTAFGEFSFWAFPVWSTLLVVTAIILARHDRDNLFPLVRRCMAVVLVALMLPMAWEMVPRELRTAQRRPEVRLSLR